MRYRWSILNIAAGIFMLWCLIFAIMRWDVLSGGEGWGVIGMIALSAFGIGALIVDFILQQLIRDRKILNITGAIIAAATAWFLWFGF